MQITQFFIHTAYSQTLESIYLLLSSSSLSSLHTNCLQMLKTHLSDRTTPPLKLTTGFLRSLRSPVVQHGASLQVIFFPAGILRQPWLTTSPSTSSRSGRFVSSNGPSCHLFILSAGSVAATQTPRRDSGTVGALQGRGGGCREEGEQGGAGRSGERRARRRHVVNQTVSTVLSKSQLILRQPKRRLHSSSFWCVCGGREGGGGSTPVSH